LRLSLAQTTPVIFPLIIVLAVLFCCEVSGEKDKITSLLHLKVINERVVEATITVRCPKSVNYSHCYILLPFAIESELTTSPRGSICTSGRLADRITLLSVWIPPDLSQLEIRVRTHSLVQQHDPNWCRLEMNFDYSKILQTTDLERLSREHSFLLVPRFQEVTVEFPVGTDLRRVDDNPRPSDTNGYRKYSSESLSKSGERLIILFPSRAYVVEIFEIAILLIPGVIAIAVREELRKKPLIPRIASIVSWILFGMAAYLYLSNVVPLRHLIVFLAYALLFAYEGSKRMRQWLRVRS